MSHSSTTYKKKSSSVPANRYKPESVRQIIIAIATESGVTPSDACLFADALIEADLQGTSTHGVSRLKIYIDRIRKGLIDPAAKLEVERQRGATLVVNAGNGLGQVQAVKTLKTLMPVARKYGVAACTIHNSQHCGALSYYCNQAAKNHMILFATTNSEPSMAPKGASEAYFGTNPLASSFPTGKGYPIKIDLATSLVARGNIIAAQKEGESIPRNWALSEEGEPTTDAAEALAGTMLPMAGHKGYALAMMVEIFSGVLSGAAIGPSVGSMYDDMDRQQDVGHFFCLLDISSFMDIGEFKQRIDTMIEEIKACQKRPNANEIRIPGERSHQTAKQNSKQGIIIEEATQQELQRLCHELDIEYTL
ncbi:Malate/lactate/ureidoglycolate dehydrogenase, LDH2 family [Fodinibius roseus]|uniref:Malate/lactate/ureidoglycolate dehydrogenase, LDH2 family n=1 Tax=Fodinibius roseus TaxID=1194090 RepID=A0A1M5LX19_9BACT|nr:Ldh family oxidoreductase [Fodinibius roseus]SHG69199.1 Malate/lactate/ureidoglycolate dehydrogenase, LDH2 family [Fodinibius roseus]